MTKTSEFIKKISTEPVSSAAVTWNFLYWVGWLFISVLILAILIVIAPLRADFSRSLVQSPQFLGESFLWLALTVISVYMAYLSVLPGRLRSNFFRILAFLFSSLIAAALFRLTTFGLSNELIGEMDFYRGRCGIIILVSGVVSTSWMFFILRKAAPTRLALTGVLSAVSSAAFCALLMQFICRYENTLHIAIWHFLPIFILSFISSIAAHRFLRW